MKLVLLGTAGYHPNETRHTLCAMIPEVGVILDAGTGIFRARDRLCTPFLDVLLTHAHLDHVVGLTYLFDILWEKSIDRVTVHGSAATLAAIRDHLLAEPLFPVPLPCEYQTLERQVALAGGGNATWFPLVHPGGAVGYRLAWPGHSLAFVTDTTAAPDADYVRQIEGVDLLIHECNFADREHQWAKKTGHSHTTPVAQVAKAAGVGRVVLVHSNPLVPGLDECELATARRIFPDVVAGSDLMEIEF